jgi:MFS family permease
MIAAGALRRGYRLTAGVLLVMMLGGTLPVPLYILYEKQMGFGPLGVTVVFAAYVVGTLLALVLLGDLSDHIGRRLVLTMAAVCAAVSTGIFLAAGDIGALIVARVVSGLAAGFATGTATAALTELEPGGDHRSAAVVATGSNLTGLGLGPLVAGLFAQYIGAPTRTVFWVYLGACAVALAAVAVIPETVRHPDHAISVRPRLAAPPQIRMVIVGACLGVFAAFSILGLFSSLVPTFLHGLLGLTNLALIGGGSFLIFVCAAVSQAFSARVAARVSVGVGVPILLVCLGTFESALFTKQLSLFVIAAVSGGIAVGLIFRGGISEINRVAEARHRGAVMSTFFAVAYVGLGLPAVLAGLLSVPLGPVDASVVVACLAAAMVVAAFIVVRRVFGAESADSHSGEPYEAWCRPEDADLARSSSSRPPTGRDGPDSGQSAGQDPLGLHNVDCKVATTKITSYATASSAAVVRPLMLFAPPAGGASRAPIAADRDGQTSRCAS